MPKASKPDKVLKTRTKVRNYSMESAWIIDSDVTSQCIFAGLLLLVFKLLASSTFCSHIAIAFFGSHLLPLSPLSQRLLLDASRPPHR